LLTWSEQLENLEKVVEDIKEKNE
jgi:hypothetical protein